MAPSENGKSMRGVLARIVFFGFVVVVISVIAGAFGGVGVILAGKYYQCGKSVDCAYEQLERVLTLLPEPKAPSAIPATVEAGSECLAEADAEKLWHVMATLATNQKLSAGFEDNWPILNTECPQPAHLAGALCQSLYSPGGIFGLDCSTF